MGGWLLPVRMTVCMLVCAAATHPDSLLADDLNVMVSVNVEGSNAPPSASPMPEPRPEIQLLQFRGGPFGGSFRVMFNGQFSGFMNPVAGTAWCTFIAHGMVLVSARSAKAHSFGAWTANSHATRPWCCTTHPTRGRCYCFRRMGRSPLVVGCKQPLACSWALSRG